LILLQLPAYLIGVAHQAFEHIATYAIDPLSFVEVIRE